MSIYTGSITIVAIITYLFYETAITPWTRRLWCQERPNLHAAHVTEVHRRSGTTV
jgi:hypothetical protein